MLGSNLSSRAAVAGWVLLSSACAHGVEVVPQAEALLAADTGVSGEGGGASAASEDVSDRGKSGSGGATTMGFDDRTDATTGSDGAATFDASADDASSQGRLDASGETEVGDAPADHAVIAEGAVAEGATRPPLLFDPQTIYGIHPLAAPATISIAVDGDAQTDGARLKQWGASSSDDLQKFHIFDEGGGAWRICMKANEDQCLRNPTGQTADTTPLQMWRHAAHDPWQQWVVTPDTSNVNTFVLKNVASALCVDEAYRQTTPDLTLQVYACNATIAQQWLITPNP